VARCRRSLIPRARQAPFSFAIGCAIPSKSARGYRPRRRWRARWRKRYRSIGPGRCWSYGAGTGVVIAALLAAGCAPERLIVVEREAALAAVLRARFTCRIVEGDACAIGAILDGLGVTQLAGIVSSLPIKWFPVESQRAVVLPCLDRAGTEGSFLQLTNALVSPVAMAPLGLEGEEIVRVWAQFPPVQIWRYRRAAEKVAAA
jgi:phosphatidylethanolamine/phosphatidyl-N-methylethanolamine N-methyltransferase